jgi:hypothetical protein
MIIAYDRQNILSTGHWTIILQSDCKHILQLNEAVENKIDCLYFGHHDTQRNDTDIKHKGLMRDTHYAKCRYADCYGECH